MAEIEAVATAACWAAMQVGQKAEPMAALMGEKMGVCSAVS